MTNRDLPYFKKLNGTYVHVYISIRFFLIVRTERFGTVFGTEDPSVELRDVR